MFLRFSSFFFAFPGSSESRLFFGLNCFKMSCNISEKNMFLSRLGEYLFGPSFPLISLVHTCFLFPSFSFFLFFSFSCFQCFSLFAFSFLAFVSGFTKRCFLHSGCSMEMWCPDDIGRDSWDWVGPPARETARCKTPEWGGGSSPVKTEPLQIVLLLLFFFWSLLKMCVYSHHLTHAPEQTANYRTCKPGDMGKHQPRELTHSYPGLSRNEPLVILITAPLLVIRKGITKKNPQDAIFSTHVASIEQLNPQGVQGFFC